MNSALCSKIKEPKNRKAHGGMFAVRICASMNNAKEDHKALK